MGSLSRNRKQLLYSPEREREKERGDIIFIHGTHLYIHECTMSFVCTYILSNIMDYLYASIGISQMAVIYSTQPSVHKE